MADFTQSLPPVTKVTGSLFGPPNDEVWNDYFVKQRGFLKEIGKLYDAQTWTGRNLFQMNGALKLETADPNNLNDWFVKVSRVLGDGKAATQSTTFMVQGKTVAGSRQQLWNMVTWTEDYSDPDPADPLHPYTGAVGIYGRVHKHGRAPNWGAVFEVQDDSGSDFGQLYGIEVSIQSENMDPNNYRQGIAVFYGSMTGGVSRHFAGLKIDPIFGQVNAELVYGVLVQGKALASYASSASGLAAFSATGSYSFAAISLEDVTNTPIGVNSGPGVRTRFVSGIGQGGNQTWWPGGFSTSSWDGEIEMVIDSTKVYIPVRLAHH